MRRQEKGRENETARLRRRPMERHGRQTVTDMPRLFAPQRIAARAVFKLELEAAPLTGSTRSPRGD
jgi:hypothetical protein